MMNNDIIIVYSDSLSGDIFSLLISVMKLMMSFCVVESLILNRYNDN